jgi:phosphatidylglycerophosphate synthase
MKSKTHPASYYVINGITLYRVVAAPLLLILIFISEYEWFKWLLGISFFTDLIDGFLARKFKVTSVFGTRLDSIGDDLTIVVALIAMFYWKYDFIKIHAPEMILLLTLFILQTTMAFLRYRTITSFHTYLAKLAAILQGSFLLLLFFVQNPPITLFYAVVIITALELIEECILVVLLPKWTANVKGLYWVLNQQKGKKVTL